MTKSAFFDRHEFEESGAKEIRSAFETLSSVPISKFPFAFDCFTKLQPNADAENEDVLKQLSEGLQLSQKESGIILNLLDVFSGILSNSAFHGDEHFMAEDLFEKGLISEESLPSAHAFFDLFSEENRQTIDRIKNAEQTEIGLLPYLVSCSTSFEKRIIFESRFTYGENPELYSPNAIDSVPIVTIRLVTDSGPTQTFFFQAGKKELQRLSDVISVAIKTLELI